MAITLPSLPNRLDRALRQLDALLPTKQTQKHEYAFVGTQGREHPNLITKRSGN